MNITLLGYMGSGKSTIGKQLANKMGYTFLDLDQEIEKEIGMPISKYFQENNEISFRKKEAEILDKILKNKEVSVISLGGGTPTFGNNLENIKANSYSIYLSAKIPTLVKRLEKEMKKRPLIAHLKPEELSEFIGKHLFERNAFYQQADFMVSVDDKNIEEVVNEIIPHLPQ